MNALEQMATIEDLKYAAAALHSKMLKESSRRLFKMHYPGEWTPDRLHTAHELAKSIISLLDSYKDTNDCKSFIIRKLTPLVEMKYRGTT